MGTGGCWVGWGGVAGRSAGRGESKLRLRGEQGAEPAEQAAPERASRAAALFRVEIILMRSDAACQ